MRLIRDDRLQLFIENLTLYARIGVYAHERQAQPIIIDLEVGVRCPEVDLIASTVDYDMLVDLIEKRIAMGHIELVETLATRIADDILAQTAARDVIIRICKPNAVEKAGGVGVSLARIRQQ